MRRMLSVPAVLLCALAARPAAAQTDSVVFRGTGGPISQNVTVPANRRWLITSGTVAPVLDSAATNAHTRYGDTKTQGIAILRNIEKQLVAQGLGLKDVVQMRVYVAPDAEMGGQWDFQGWFDAYAEFFAKPSNPTRVTRSTIGVAALVRPGMLIEVEAVAVYPK